MGRIWEYQPEGAMGQLENYHSRSHQAGDGEEEMKEGCRK